MKFYQETSQYFIDTNLSLVVDDGKLNGRLTETTPPTTS